LVEFEPDHIPGFQFFAMQDKLGEIFERKVDLNTDGFLSRHFQAEVREKALVYYVNP
jgi:predicted nucleotidyltransferase